MTDVAASTLSAVEAVQTALLTIFSLGLTEFRYPANTTLTNCSYFDYIIIGGGSAGSALAYRLSENSNISVLLIEEGGYPPLESEIPLLFPTLPESDYDYDICSKNDSYTAQNLRDSCISMTSGKMLGGGSSLNHMIHVQGDPHDYDNWATILGDSNWTYANLLPYFKKLENLTDPGLLAANGSALHGTDGMIKITREIQSANDPYLEAFAEIGIPTVNDTSSSTSSIGATNPLYNIDDNIRQSNAYAYLRPAKSRANLYLALSTTATKILFTNTTATGVQVTTYNGDSYTLYVNKELIVSAGAIGSAKLLMVSGIGPSDHLESLGITVVADLPVGKNFLDHPSAVLFYQMEKSTNSSEFNPYMFPVPTTTAYKAINTSQTYPDYQTINLRFPPASSALVQLCASVFKYSNDICNTFYEASVDHYTLFVVHNLMQPESRGRLLLNSTDVNSDPIVYVGTYNNTNDLDLMVECLEDFAQVVNTTYFTSVGASLVDPGLCSNASNYWECYALTMSSTMWHYAGTCAMGSVVDSELRVSGISNLRVVDASVMPTEVSGNINAAVTVIAERAAAFILADCTDC